METETSGSSTLADKKDWKPGTVSSETMEGIDAVAEEVGAEYTSLPEHEGAIAFTHFDTPSSEDHRITVLLTKENMASMPLQSLVRIKSLEDSRSYIGSVTAGPFAEPDGLRADSPIVVTTTVKGKIFLPRYHGRAYVSILGEESNNQMLPPRFRPRPNSPVFPLTTEETMKALKIGGDIRIGNMVGVDNLVVSIPSKRKDVLPRHTGIFGTTGGGKSTTNSGLISKLHRAGVATIVIDVEGEYVESDQPTADPQMKEGLAKLNLPRDVVADLRVYHLEGRETNREIPGKLHPFCLKFSDISPYAVKEILELTEPQEQRFFKTYDTLKIILERLKIYPRTSDEKTEALEIDEFDTGYPHVTISQMIDLAGVFLAQLDEDKNSKKTKTSDSGEQRVYPTWTSEFRGHEDVLKSCAAQAQALGIPISWRALLVHLWKVARLKVFDNPKAPALNYEDLIHPGRVSVFDLSDTGSPRVNNLVISDILRGVQAAQEASYKEAVKRGVAPSPVVIIIEEAHEFLSDQRIKQMPILFQQVARIARRGRKRWLGLVFSTQMPQHLPDEVLGLLNNHVIHKISDSHVIDHLRKSLGGFDAGIWKMVPSLAPGQAVVSMAHMARPIMVSVDPTPCRLKLSN